MNQPNVVVDLAAEMENEECPVCLENGHEVMEMDCGNDISTLNCGHKICENCAIKYFKPSTLKCPICRTDVWRIENSGSVTMIELFHDGQKVCIRERVEFKEY